MTAAELRAFLPGAFLGADSYAIPTIQWITGPFWEFYHARLWAGGLDQWQQRWQCNEFARSYASAAQECHARTAHALADESVAVGEMWYRRDAGGAHAICPIISDQGLVFVDPQNGLLCTLSPAELSSRFFCRF